MMGQIGHKLIGCVTTFFWNQDWVFVSNFVAHKRGHCRSSKTTRLLRGDCALKFKMGLSVPFPQIVRCQVQVTVASNGKALAPERMTIHQGLDLIWNTQTAYS